MPVLFGKVLFKLVVLYGCWGVVESYRILGIFHWPAQSHVILSSALMKELAARGHEVTVIGTDLPKETIKNYEVVHLSGFSDDVKDIQKHLYNSPNMNLIYQEYLFSFMGLDYANKTFNHPNVQKFLRSNRQYDLVIMEKFINEAFHGFCYHYKAPCVILSTMGASRYTNDQVGNPAPLSFIGDILYTKTGRFSLKEKLENIIIYSASQLMRYWYFFPKHNELMHKVFPEAPHIYDLFYNTSFILLNSHPSTNQPVPHTANMIEIGGYHVQDPKPLPGDLKAILDNATEGAILFSMGSNLKSKDMTDEKRNAFSKAFSKLKQTILWKWELDEMPDKPSNVIASKWLPQQDILAHPNIRLFITHGGLLSTTETIYHGVPILGIPVFADQETNVALAQQNGYALGIPYLQVTEEKLDATLKELINNPKYAVNAKRRSSIMKDRPMKPIDTAIYWIEYVIRHGGAPHLKSVAVELDWFQYFCLDVFLLIVVTACVTYKSLKCLVKLISPKHVDKLKTN